MTTVSEPLTEQDEDRIMNRLSIQEHSVNSGQKYYMSKIESGFNGMTLTQSFGIPRIWSENPY
jgi:hypothetical protein